MSDAPNTPSAVATGGLRVALARSRVWRFAPVIAGAPLAALAFSFGDGAAKVLVNVVLALVAGALLPTRFALARSVLPGRMVRRPGLVRPPRRTGVPSPVAVDAEPDPGPLETAPAREGESHSITGRSRR